MKNYKPKNDKSNIKKNKHDIKNQKLILKANNSNNNNFNIQNNSRNNSDKRYINNVKQTTQDNQDQTAN